MRPVEPRPAAQARRGSADRQPDDDRPDAELVPRSGSMRLVERPPVDRHDGGQPRRPPTPCSSTVAAAGAASPRSSARSSIVALRVARRRSRTGSSGSARRRRSSCLRPDSRPRSGLAIVGPAEDPSRCTIGAGAGRAAGRASSRPARPAATPASRRRPRQLVGVAHRSGRVDQGEQRLHQRGAIGHRMVRAQQDRAAAAVAVPPVAVDQVRLPQRPRRVERDVGLRAARSASASRHPRARQA